MLLTTLLLACRSDDPTGSSDGTPGTTVPPTTTDTGPTAPPADPVTDAFTWDQQDVDLLFVIDSSSSMTGRVAELTAAMAPLMDNWLARGIDFHVGVVDIDDSPVQGQLVEVGGLRWVDPTLPEPGQTLQQLADAVGDPSTLETGLAASYKALNLTGPGQPNEGFVRDGSELAVLVATDEMDQTDPGLVTPAEYVPWLLGLREDPALVGFHAFVATEDYLEIATQTGGVGWNVANTPYGPALEAVTATVEVDNAFVLTRDADPDTLEARVLEPGGGEIQLVGEDLDYDEDDRTVDLGAYYPPSGSTVEITYVPLPE